MSDLSAKYLISPSWLFNQFSRNNPFNLEALPCAKPIQQIYGFRVLKVLGGKQLQ
jgi:hypothetical protein